KQPADNCLLSPVPPQRKILIVAPSIVTSSRFSTSTSTSEYIFSASGQQMSCPPSCMDSSPSDYSKFRPH
ncbi:hypothetical protein LEMLEM_LOCUS24283, partial [Lemmus lemmus]